MMKSKAPKLRPTHVMVKSSSPMRIGTSRVIPSHANRSPLATVTRKSVPPVGQRPRRRMAAPWTKLCVEPVSRRARKRSPLMNTGSSMALGGWIPATE